MAIFHLELKIINRSGGRSAVAAAAYRSGTRLHDEETGIVHDYTRKGGVVYSEVMLPSHVPEAYRNRKYLWNEVQKVENKANSQFAREVVFGLPIEMTREEQLECTRAYFKKNFVDKGMMVDWALHDKKDGNPHVHGLATMREMDENGNWKEKAKSVFANSFDEAGKPIFDPALPCYDPKRKEETAQYRIPALDENGNQKTRVRPGRGEEKLWVKVKIPVNDWDSKKMSEKWRASWAEHCNRYLPLEKHIDHRSFKRQGINREATIHEGYVARKIEKAGGISDRCEINRSIRERNRLAEEIRKITQEITQLILMKARKIYERFKRFEQYFRVAGETVKTAGYSRTAAEGTGYITEAAGRIAGLKRTVDSTDERIAGIKAVIQRKEQDINGRLEQLRKRRTAFVSAGRTSESDRKSTAGTFTGERKELRAAGADIRAFLDQLRTSEGTAAEKRADREAARIRFNPETEHSPEAADERYRGHSAGRGR